MQRSKFRWFVKVWRLLKLDKRAMQIRGVTFHLKLVILYTLRSPLWEVPAGSRLKENWLQDMLWTIQDNWPQGRSRLSTRVATSVIRRARCIPSVATQEMFASSKGTTTDGRGWPGRWTYSERPIKILDITERVTRSKVIKMCKVQWCHHTEDEATWEHEEELRADYPKLFPSASWILGEILLRG
jgi:hypothetical protein